ncbi:hypothetical protein MBLNU459_g4395t1 [Dothideomycetes sp. NU459]
MKQRFSSLDVKVIAHELSNSLVSLRLSNVYDLSTVSGPDSAPSTYTDARRSVSQRIFLLKFAKPEHREQLLIDSGFRCHLTSFARATAAAPSPFVARLRKYLRTRRVTSVSQVGTDRIIEIQFSDGAYRLFLEFYAGGNVVLTDNDLTIIALLRNVSEGAEHEQYRLGLTYNLSLRQNYDGVPPLTKERVRNGLQKAVDRLADEPAKASKIKKKPGDALRKALAVSITEFPPVVLDHALEVTGFDKNTLPSQVLESEESLDRLMAVFEEAAKVIASITSVEKATGYIVAKRNKSASDGEAPDDQGHGGLMYDDFHPFKPKQLETKPDNTFLDFSGFNKTVDEFFSSIEGQKLESKLQEREETAKKRLEQARQEHNKRIGGLQQVQELNVRRAQAIEGNLDRVEEAAAAVNGLIAQGMDWVEISRLIEMEQSRHNPVAEMIKLPLKLHENTVTVLLAEYGFEDEDDDMDDLTDEEPSDSEDEAPSKTPRVEEKRIAVDIDLGLSGWSNARQYYDQRKAAATKQEKTEQASTKALKSTEQRIQADLKKGLKQEKAVLRPVRKQMWFEKFIYFISSDGYIVLGGKDAQQNEILYRRYLKKGDVYVHADLNGAASVIIKNNPSTADAPIPPSTLSQAGNLSVCTSNAWDSKAVMSAWWVNADQVSKTAPTGEYLAVGGFTIRGKKNFLPPAQLLLGFAVMFQISEESKANHLKHRVKPEEAGSLAPEAVPGEPENGESDDDFPDADKDDDGSDDDFPDAKEASTDESDDDVPDAQNGDDSEGSDAEAPPQRRSNPLQPQSSAPVDATPETGTTAQSEDEADDAEDQDDGRSGQIIVRASAAPPGMRDLSARERREQRKGAASNKPTEKNAPPKRGKRSKAKKAASKYADQDEEDRRIAMQLLGSRAAEEKREQAAEEEAGKTETAEAAKIRRREQHERAQREGLEAEAIRRMQLEDGVEPLEEEEAASLMQLDALVGMPLAGDEILEAIPVCAPWAALAKYKYKVKLQPGAQKKGKAVRELLTRWVKAGAEKRNLDPTAQDKERIWPREAELIKGWKEPEIIGVVPVSKVRVMMSGGQSGGSSEAAKGKKNKQRGQKKGKK